MKVLVTGGASGLGLAISQRLLAMGDEVFFTFHRANEQAQRLERKSPNAHAIRCDFGDSSSVSALLGQVGEIELDGLVNNAITGLSRVHAHKASTEDLARAFATDVLPTIAITQHVLARFRKARRGRVVTVLTSYLREPAPVGLGGYVAAKAYLAQFCRSWAHESAAFGIAIATVSPGMMRTGLTADLDPAASAGPLVKLEDVAETIAFLLRCSANFNGADIPIVGAHVV